MQLAKTEMWQLVSQTAKVENISSFRYWNEKSQHNVAFQFSKMREENYNNDIHELCKLKQKNNGTSYMNILTQNTMAGCT